MKDKRVLIIEDSADQATLLELIINTEMPGAEAIAVPTANEAVRVAREFGPTLVVADLSLNCERNGLEVAREIRRENPAVEIILLTGHDTVMEGINVSPARTVLMKPVDVEELVEAVKAAA